MQRVDIELTGIGARSSWGRLSALFRLIPRITQVPRGPGRFAKSTNTHKYI
jgi:hypothetical protein